MSTDYVYKCFIYMYIAILMSEFDKKMKYWVKEGHSGLIRICLSLGDEQSPKWVLDLFI